MTREAPALCSPGSSSVTSEPAIVCCGIDTFSVSWQVPISAAAGLELRQGDRSPHLGDVKLRALAGGGLMTREQIAGMHYGVWLGRDNGSTSLWMEGRAPTDGILASIQDVLAAIECGETFWQEHGCDPFGVLTARIRRLDPAVDVLAQDHEIGARLLADLALAPLGRGMRKRCWYDAYATGEYMSGVDLIRQPGDKQHVQLRAYDKALEQNRKAGQTRPAAAGEHVRIERQLRFRSEQRPYLTAMLTPERLAAEWRAPIEGLLTPAHTPSEAVQRVLAAYSDGLLDASTAQRLAGRLTLRAHDPTATSSDSTEARAKRDLAALGITRVADTQVAPSSYQLLQRAANSWNDLAPAPASHPLMQDPDEDALLI